LGSQVTSLRLFSPPYTEAPPQPFHSLFISMNPPSFSSHPFFLSGSFLCGAGYHLRIFLSDLSSWLPGSARWLFDVGGPPHAPPFNLGFFPDQNLRSIVRFAWRSVCGPSTGRRVTDSRPLGFWTPLVPFPLPSAVSFFFAILFCVCVSEKSSFLFCSPFLISTFIFGGYCAPTNPPRPLFFPVILGFYLTPFSPFRSPPSQTQMFDGALAASPSHFLPHLIASPRKIFFSTCAG